jgi:hypothetical protein
MMEIEYDFPETKCPWDYRGGPMSPGELISVGSMTCGNCKSFLKIKYTDFDESKSQGKGIVSCSYSSPLHICNGRKKCGNICKDYHLSERHDIPHYKHYSHCVSKMWCGGNCVVIKTKDSPSKIHRFEKEIKEK